MVEDPFLSKILGIYRNLNICLGMKADTVRSKFPPEDRSLDNILIYTENDTQVYLDESDNVSSIRLDFVEHRKNIYVFNRKFTRKKQYYISDIVNHLLINTMEFNYIHRYEINKLGRILTTEYGDKYYFEEENKKYVLVAVYLRVI